jgi:hypothetical protein
LALGTTALQITTGTFQVVRGVLLTVDPGYTGSIVVGFTSAITFSTTSNTTDSATLTGKDRFKVGPEEIKSQMANLWFLASTTAGAIVRGWIM